MSLCRKNNDKILTEKNYITITTLVVISVLIVYGARISNHVYTGLMIIFPWISGMIVGAILATLHTRIMKYIRTVNNNKLAQNQLEQYLINRP